MTLLSQDIRYALRRLRKSPAFAATAILTLALGIGATTAIFTLIYQVMLRSIPVSHPEQLYKVGKEIECCVDGGLQNDWRIFSWDLYTYFRDHTPGTDGVAAVSSFRLLSAVRRQNDSAAAQPLDLRFVSGNYFPVLGVPLFRGRTLTPDDDREGAAPVAVISYTLWQTKFAADPSLIGSTLLLTGHPVTVVGITAPGFLGERNEADPPGIWLPIAQEPVIEPQRPLRTQPPSHWLDILVRIHNPASVPQAQLAIQNELKQWLQLRKADFSDNTTAQDFAKQTTELAPANTGINDLSRDFAASLKLLFLVAAFVLLIACANLANLLLVRGMARSQEIALRSAIGAPRSRIIREMLVEAILLALFGGAAAIAVAFLGTRAILALAMHGAEVNPVSASPSLTVIGFAFLVSLVTGLLFGTAPAWIASRTSPADALRGANRGSRETGAKPQRALVIFQAALSLALLTTAGILIASLRTLEHQDFHFQTEGRLVAFIDLQAAGYQYPQLANLYRRMDDIIGHLPSVESFAYATYSPLADNNWGTGVSVAGHETERNKGASYAFVSAHYFDTVGTRLLRGRLIEEQDTATSRNVAVVNAAFVRKLLDGRQPIGEHFGQGAQNSHDFEIVGVVDDTKYGSPSSEIRPMFFKPITQAITYKKPEDISGENTGHYASNLVVHFRGDSASAANELRNALKSIDPQIPITRLVPYQDQVAQHFTQEVLVVRLTSLFGILALLLASLGLYGVTTYTVARRTNEIGIRMALGATRANVLAMIVRSALLQVGIGLAIGIPLTFLAARMLQHSLYQTSAFQPLVMLCVILAMLVCALAAAAFPARRAASIEPNQALRAE